tara:strand:- start:256 stop:456 length:201 start_codon:yes stop_codon:yes gene_type:complete
MRKFKHIEVTGIKKSNEKFYWVVDKAVGVWMYTLTGLFVYGLGVVLHILFTEPERFDFDPLFAILQ